MHGQIIGARKLANIKQAERILRGKLSKLNNQRHHSIFITEDDAGRAMLKALFRFGLTIEDAEVIFLERKNYARVPQRSAP